MESLSKNRKRHNTYYKNNPQYRLKQIVKTQEKKKKLLSIVQMLEENIISELKKKEIHFQKIELNDKKNGL